MALARLCRGTFGCRRNVVPAMGASRGGGAEERAVCGVCGETHTMVYGLCWMAVWSISMHYGMSVRRVCLWLAVCGTCTHDMGLRMSRERAGGCADGTV